MPYPSLRFGVPPIAIVTMTTKAQPPKLAADVDGQLPEEMLPTPFRPWHEAGVRLRQRLVIGGVAGGIAGCVSLLLSVIGGVAWTAVNGETQHPLRLIQVFLTFPLGAAALQISSGAVLALGCLLYLATGILYGMILEFAISYLLPYAGLSARLAFFLVSALALWLVNFYGLISWLQPLLFHGHWIVDLIPWWVAALTHLAFGATLALVDPLGNQRLRLVTPDS